MKSSSEGWWEHKITPEEDNYFVAGWIAGVLSILLLQRIFL